MLVLFRPGWGFFPFSLQVRQLVRNPSRCLKGFYLFTRSANCNRLNQNSAGTMSGRSRAVS